MHADTRPAHNTDVHALVAIEAAGFEGNRISARSFRDLIRSTSAAILVAEGEGKIVGYCTLLFRVGSSRARLYSIAIAPGSRGEGLGTHLLEAAEAAVQARGGLALGLEVRQDNPRAIALYERHGYRHVGMVPGYYADGVAALRLEKKLMPRPVAPLFSAEVDLAHQREAKEMSAS